MELLSVDPKLGGRKQIQGIGSGIYNEIMNSSWEEIFSDKNPYAARIQGAAMPVYYGKDYSNGAYFWNASSPDRGFVWNQYKNGTFVITMTAGASTFLKYSNTKKTWP